MVSRSVMEFCRATDNPKNTVIDLAKILDRDAGLVVELLRTVNSSTSGVRNKVSSSKAALGLLGVRRAKMFVLTSSVQMAAQKMKSPLIDSNRFSFAAMQRAVFARRLADRLGHDGELAFAAALLQDFLIPALTLQNTNRYRTLLETLNGDVASFADLERTRFGWDHSLAGGRLMLSWQFPDDLICLVLSHHRLDSILGSPPLMECELVDVALSSLLPDPLDSLPVRQELLEHHLKSLFGIDIAAFQTWVAEDLQYTGVAHDPSLAWTARGPQGSEKPARTAVGASSAVVA